jgi:hypothetical protein
MNNSSKKKKNITDLVKMVVDDYKEQVKDMSDDELMEDRSEWMKKYGIPNSTYDHENSLASSIHTITIELEQVNRFGEIIYGDTDENRNRITEY